MASSYKAFISYSHDDERWAKWLQRSLERYRIPKRLTDTASNPLPRRLYPIFRDRSELSSSSDLGASLKESLQRSEYLIVICSPSAAKSKWLNEEVQYFHELGRSDRILCFMVDGEPDTGSQQCAFPPALVQSGAEGASIEHLAADPRHDGNRNALLKIVGGMLGVGIDDLKQRDAQRRVRVFAGIAAGSAVVAVAMLVLSFYAVSAQREAELRRGQAEELIGFMLGDLRGKLQPIGRLDILDAVGVEAMNYFAALDENATPQDLLSRGMALRQIGEVRFSQGQLENALQSFIESRTVLQRLYEDDESVNEYLFELGQSQFWVGYVHYERAQLPEAAEAMDSYLRVSRELLQREPDNQDYLSELAHAYSNLGSVDRARGDLQSASENFQASVRINEQQLEISSGNENILNDLAGGYSWIGSSEMALGDLAAAQRAFETSLQQWRTLSVAHDNARYRERTAYAELLLATSLLYQGKLLEAIELNRSGYTGFVELMARDSENDRWRRGRAFAARALAENLLHLQHYDKAGSLLVSAIEDLRQLAAADATNTDTRSQLSLALAIDALAKLRSGDEESAMRSASAAHDQMITTISGSEISLTNLENAALVSDVFTSLLQSSGQSDRARAVRREMYDLLTDSAQTSLLLVAELNRLATQLGEVDVAAETERHINETELAHPRFVYSP